MILVAGGTGRLGSAVANQLAGRGLEVKALCRGVASPSGALHGSVEVVHGDVRNPTSLRGPFEGVDMVVSAVQGFMGAGGVSPATVDRDGNGHLIDAAEVSGAHFVLVSVIGAAPDSPMELLRMKFAAEERLKSSRCRWTIVRADAFAETWVSLMAESAGSKCRPLVFGRASNPISFVSVTDVAALVVRAVVDESLRGRVLEICGPYPVSMTQLAELVMAKRDWIGTPRRVPRPVLQVIAHTVGPVNPQLARQARAALAIENLPTAHDETLRTEFPDLPHTPVSQVIEESSG
jgi:NADH dehydrogenase